MLIKNGITVYSMSAGGWLHPKGHTCYTDPEGQHGYDGPTWGAGTTKSMLSARRGEHGYTERNRLKGKLRKGGKKIWAKSASCAPKNIMIRQLLCRFLYMTPVSELGHFLYPLPTVVHVRSSADDWDLYIEHGCPYDLTFWICCPIYTSSAQHACDGRRGWGK